MTCLIGAKRSPADRRVEAAADLKEVRLQTSNMDEPAKATAAALTVKSPAPLCCHALICRMSSVGSSDVPHFLIEDQG